MYSLMWLVTQAVVQCGGDGGYSTCGKMPYRKKQLVMVQELLPILLACMIWRPWWVDSLMVTHCDNQAVSCQCAKFGQ